MTIEEIVEEEGKRTIRRARIKASQAPEAEVKKEVSDDLGVDPRSLSDT